MMHDDFMTEQYKCLLDVNMDSQARNIMNILLRETIKLRNDAPGISDEEMHHVFNFTMRVAEQLGGVVVDEITKFIEAPKGLPDNINDMLLDQSNTQQMVKALVQILNTTPLQQMQTMATGLQEEQERKLSTPQKSLFDQVLDAPVQKPGDGYTPHAF